LRAIRNRAFAKWSATVAASTGLVTLSSSPEITRAPGGAGGS
jgi:hypothetical protein